MGAVAAKRQFDDDMRNEIRRQYEGCQDKEIVIWGIGNYGEMLYQELSAMGMSERIIGFCDDRDSVSGTYFHGKRVNKIQELYPNNRHALYLIASSYADAIIEHIPKDIKDEIQILELSQFEREAEVAFATKKQDDYGRPIIFLDDWFRAYEKNEENLQYMEFFLDEVLEDDQSKSIISNRLNFFKTGHIEYIMNLKKSVPIYFDNEYLPFGDNEVLFDLGGYTGDSTNGFIELVKGKYKKVHIFEPDEDNYLTCKKRIEDNNWHDVFLHKSGAGEFDEYLSFTNDGTGGAKICEDGEYKVRVERVDDYFPEKPTIIKMDIEGAEMACLRGSKRVISQLKPKLAISIYHKPFDFYEIPKFLKELVPEYHFKVRHHTEYLYDTVLYAYP